MKSNQGTDDDHHHDVEGGGGLHYVSPILKPTNVLSSRNTSYDVSSTMSRLCDSMAGTNSSGLNSSSPSLPPPFDLNTENTFDFGLDAVEEQSDCSADVSISTTPMLKSSDEIYGAYDTFATQTVASNGNNEQKKQVQNTPLFSSSCSQKFLNAFHQLPAVALIAMFHLMIGIPFGVSYFSIGWKEQTEFYEASTNSTAAAETSANPPLNADVINGPFPIHGKNALGIRMFLFSTIVGQIVFTFKSGFRNPIGLQMVENVPFCQALTAIAIEHCGYGIEALSTLFVMFGLSSIIVGAVFFALGKLELGRIIYFFPKNVLMGLIGGIGIFIAKTGIEVTINSVFSIEGAFVQHFNLLSVVIFFELLLRVLEKLNRNKETGKPLFTLLAPIYFCSITPIFYISLWVIGYKVEDAENNGYFFPRLAEDGCTSSEKSGNCSSSSSGPFASFLESTIFSKDVLDMWTAIDFSVVSWSAISASIPTLVAITIFSLIHVPINIPAFAISTNTEYDMNNELIAHGYSNCISGCFGGLQNYFAYTQSILYDRSGGFGRASGVAVAIVTTMLFFVGPTIASYIPRCMAGTLLLHVGIDLFLEGVYDTYGKFEFVEYIGIWLITIVMTMKGMDAALIASAITAVSTYAVQTVAYLEPVRGFMSGATLRSSQRNRGYKANAILESSENGRCRILVIQLQGHLFFGNVSQLNQSMNAILSSKQSSLPPLIVIVDFSLVLGIDSSAAQAIVKLKKLMLEKYLVRVALFVPGGSNGFPCEYDLSNELGERHVCTYQGNEHLYTTASNEETGLLMHHLQSRKHFEYEGSHVCQTLDFALALSENALIAHHDPTLLRQLMRTASEVRVTTDMSEAEEQNAALYYLEQINSRNDVSREEMVNLLSYFDREVYKKGDLLWKQGSHSDCAKLIISGKLIAMLENEAGSSEIVQLGRLVGELGLVAGANRMNSLYCESDSCITYSITRDSFEEMTRSDPKLARFIDLICIDYLLDRVQHVSNRIFETRCLPI
eukprot:CAMPEP_0203676618 /NCGR_PEP_ID=MMETSP0090-20130426/25110_1 /ASSEMBLY_ACC=CAM_ASM_001088 /TAXON_ID=426623 /ORGANISM="Chaetoceros affinis, Strain CCMP159" /LENGTH=1010 /DNA_ID=CAMNT_0050543211 /DNA_START=44 /DNA_END=3076 /DNA_ORIENTATION=-